MLSPEASPHLYVPTVSIDTHFECVPRFEEVTFDAERCVQLLTHPAIGIQPKDMSRIHVNVRPDYDFYPKTERRAIRKAHPDDYDDAGSMELLLHDGPYGAFGDVLITIVWGAGYGPNALLCHEAIHARYELQSSLLGDVRHATRAVARPKLHKKCEAAEEVEADRAMKNVALKGLRKGIITVVRHPKR